MNRDFESAKHEYSAESYLEVLDAEVAPAYELLNFNYIFIQNNAFIHTVKKIKK